MTQRSIVTAMMPAAPCCGANRYFLPSCCFVSLPFGELMAAPRLLVLEDQKMQFCATRMNRLTSKRVRTLYWGSGGGMIAKIGQEVSGGAVLVHGLAVRVRHGSRL